VPCFRRGGSQEVVEARPQKFYFGLMMLLRELLGKGGRFSSSDVEVQIEEEVETSCRFINWEADKDHEL